MYVYLCACVRVCVRERACVITDLDECAARRRPVCGNGDGLQLQSVVAVSERSPERRGDAGRPRHHLDIRWRTLLRIICWSRALAELGVHRCDNGEHQGRRRDGRLEPGRNAIARHDRLELAALGQHRGQAQHAHRAEKPKRAQ